MPREARELMEPGESLLDVCLEVHAGKTGASDPLSGDRILRNYKILRLAIQHWDEGPSFSKKFDDAVKSVISATIEEMLWTGPL